MSINEKILAAIAARKAAAASPPAPATTPATVTPVAPPPVADDPPSIVPPDAPTPPPRRRRASATAAQAPAPPAAAEPAPAPTPPAAAEPAPAPTPPAAAPTTSRASWAGAVYVDCYPVRGSTRPSLAEDVIALAATTVAERKEVADWRLIQYTAKAELARVLGQMAADGEIPPDVVVSSYTSGSDVLLEVLVPRAKVVVRGMRG